MFWKGQYESFLEGEIERLRSENRILLAALLEARGLREAAGMVRGKEMSNQELSKKAAVVYAKDGGVKLPTGFWRSQRSEMERASIPTETHDSADVVQARVEEMKHGN
jgi:hypothetical protein